MREIALLVRADGTFAVQARDVEGGVSYPVAKGFVDVDDPFENDADNFIELAAHRPRRIGDVEGGNLVEAAAWLRSVMG